MGRRGGRVRGGKTEEEGRNGVVVGRRQAGVKTRLVL